MKLLALALLFVTILVVVNANRNLVRNKVQRQGRRNGKIQKRTQALATDDPKLCGRPMKSVESCCSAPDFFDQALIDSCLPKNNNETRKAILKATSIRRRTRQIQSPVVHVQINVGRRARRYEKIFLGPCVMECAYNTMFKDVNGVNKDDINNITMRFTQNVSTAWEPIIKQAVNICITALPDAMANRTYSPSKVPTCKYDVLLFMSCLNRYLALNCPAEHVNTSAVNCTENLNKVRNCDPFTLNNRTMHGDDQRTYRGLRVIARTGQNTQFIGLNNEGVQERVVKPTVDRAKKVNGSRKENSQSNVVLKLTVP